MLWRENWRCRLISLMKIVTLWCVVFALVSGMQTHETLVVILWGSLGAFMFVYAINWSARRKGRDVLAAEALDEQNVNETSSGQ
jgi:hypothetical protein